MVEASGTTFADPASAAVYLSMRAPRARQAYLQAALMELLRQPLVIHGKQRSVCVVVFGHVAFLNRNGRLSVARHDRGVLMDVETALDEAVEELPVRPTVHGIRTLAAFSIAQEAARSLVEWSDQPVDLRGLDQSAWSELANRSAVFDTLWEDAVKTVNGIPASRWRSMAMAIPRALGVDFTLVKASRAAQLGDLSPLEVYHHAHSSGLQHLSVEEKTPQVLVAHILCATYASNVLRPNLKKNALWIQRELQLGGVTPLGWRLLLESPIGYWRSAFRSGGYDLQLTRLCLIVGQKLSPPRLPPLDFAGEAHDIAWLHDLGDKVRHVPPQVWRTLIALHERAPDICKEVLAVVLPWAAAVGSGMPASLRIAGFRTLEQHAMAHLLDHECGEPAPNPHRLSHRYQDHEGFAQELTNQETVSLVGRMMGNCLPALWPEIEAGHMRVFFAVWREQRIVIGLRPNPDGPGWRVGQVEGRRRKRVREEGRGFAVRLCATLRN